MNWLLVVIVLGTPVKTDLVYKSLQDCLQAEVQMRADWAAAFNAAKSEKPARSPESIGFLSKQTTSGTCIPSQ